MENNPWYKANIEKIFYLYTLLDYLRFKMDEGIIYECELCVSACFYGEDRKIWCSRFNKDVKNSDAETCKEYECVI